MRSLLAKKLRPSPVLFVAIAALVIALGGIAYATIPDSNGVIHGCYSNKGGALSVIDTGKGQTCSTGRTPLSWNQTGPPGPTGATGLRGPTGPQGPPGIANLDQNEASVSVPYVVGGLTTATVQCPRQGDKPLSGIYNAPYDMFVVGMMPLANGFTFSIMNGYGQTETVTIGVICAQVG